MALMTKEKDSSQDNSNDPWAITDDLLEEAKKAGEKVRKFREEQQEAFEKMVLYCPYDNSPSKFVGFKGAYTIVRAFFKCENGHEFPLSQGKTSPSDK